MIRRILSGLGLVCLATLLLVLPAAGSGGGSDEVNPSGIVVDDPTTQTCPGIDFTSIQAAVDASPAGSTIQVCPGVYNEQVVINKRLRLKGVAHNNEDAPIVKPTGVVANTTSLTTGFPIAAIILVRATRSVTIENLTVDGLINGIGACAPRLIGIYYRNASGKVENNSVRNMTLGPGLIGCQSGLGIFVQSGTETGVDPTSKVEIDGNTVHDYDKNGITGNETGTDLSIRDNTVTGIGTTNDVAQNGIQLANGAKGTISKNSVMNHVYGLCTPTVCTFVSTNVLLIDAVKPEVKDNTLGNSQVNVYQAGDRGEVEDNTIFQTLVFDGIALIGNRNEAKDNTINDSDEAGVYVEGDDNEVEKNTINEAETGILIFPTSTDTDLGGNNFFNVVLKIVGPSSMRAMGLKGPDAHSMAREVSAARP